MVIQYYMVEIVLEPTNGVNEVWVEDVESVAGAIAAAVKADPSVAKALGDDVRITNVSTVYEYDEDVDL